MSRAIALSGGKETAKFVSMLDKFFYCLNVSNFTAGKKSRKSFKALYQCASDFHLKVSCLDTDVSLWCCLAN